MGFLFLSLFFCLPGCTAPGKAQKALEAQGYTDIQLGGYSWAACSDDDTFSTAFEATSPSGQENTKGAVCCGLLKGCTIRTW